MTTDRRQEILDAALTSFNEKGVAATTVDDVRRLSGASVGSLYHHFGGKDELAQELYVEILRDYQRGFLVVLRGERDPSAASRGLCDTTSGGCAGTPSALATCSVAARRRATPCAS